MRRLESRWLGILMSGAVIFLGAALLIHSGATRANPGGVPDALEALTSSIVAVDANLSDKIAALDGKIGAGFATLEAKLGTLPSTPPQIQRIHTASGTLGATLHVDAAPRKGTVHFEFFVEHGDSILECEYRFATIPFRDNLPSQKFRVRSFQPIENVLLDPAGDTIYSHLTFRRMARAERLISLDVEADEVVAAVLECVYADASTAPFHEYNQAAVRATYLSK